MARTPRVARGAELGRVPSNGVPALPQGRRSKPDKNRSSIRRAGTPSDVCLWHLTDSDALSRCLFSGVKQTLQIRPVMSAYDPYLT